MTCPLCAAGHWRVGAEHFNESSEGVTNLGPCLEPPKREVMAETVAERRTHEQCLAAIHDRATRSSAVRVLHEAHETYTTHSQVEEDDE